MMTKKYACMYFLGSEWLSYVWKTTLEEDPVYFTQVIHWIDGIERKSGKDYSVCPFQMFPF